MRRLLKWIAFTAVVSAVLLVYVLYPPPPRVVRFPDGKRFVFSIVDDTDQTYLSRVKPLYDAMHEAGLKTTKTVWSLERSEEPLETNKGDTLVDPAYRAFILDLHRKGFEIAIHGVRGGSSPREVALKGLDEFKAAMGFYPRLHVNHAANHDNLYWGTERWTFAPFRWGFGVVTSIEFSGHNPQSKYFWGDAARERIQYVRRFTYNDINLLKVNPSMPYRLAETPYVNYWFDNSDGGSLDAFEELLSPQNLDRLEREGGVCIVYAHLGAGSFTRDGKADPRFLARIRDVASRNGWFAPASVILDYLAAQPGWTPTLSTRQRIRLEAKYMLERVRLQAKTRLARTPKPRAALRKVLPTAS